MKLTTAKAAERIEASADNVSQLLLHREQVCFTAIVVAFRTHVPPVRAQTVSAVRNSDALRESWVAAYAAAVDGCTKAVASLAEYAATRGAQSALRELTLCEKALPARYAGIAEGAVRRVDAEAIAHTRMVVWVADTLRLSSLYRADQTHQIGQSRTVDELRLRLFSEETAPIPGHRQRGVFWTAVPYLQSKARWVSISTANAVRIAAMARFNRLGEPM